MKTKLPQNLKAVTTLLLVVLCLAVYYPALMNGFVWDDEVFLLRSTIYSGSDRITASLFQPFVIHAAYYRPFIALSFALIPASTDHAAIAHHAINLAMHIMIVCLTFLCTLEIFSRFHIEAAVDRKRVVAAAVAAVIVALHPLALEPMLWISGRFDLAVTLFCLCFVYVALHARMSTARTALLATIYFFAATSKESSAVFPFVMVLIHTLVWTFESEGGRWLNFMWRQRGAYCAIFFAGASYLVLRFYVMSMHPEAGSGLLTGAGSWKERALLASFSLLEYLRLVLAPWIATAPVHPYDFSGVGPLIRIALPLGMLLLVGALCAFLVKSRWRWPYPILIFVAMISPVLHLISFSGASSLTADRYALAPLALSLIVAVPLCVARFEKAALSRVFIGSLSFILILIFVSWIAVARVTTLMWRDDVSLWAYAYSRAPESDMAASNYVSALLKVGKLDEAEVVAKRIRESGRSSMGPLTNYALIRAVRGDFEAAYGMLEAVDVNKTKGLSAGDLATYYCAFAQIDKLKGDWKAVLRHSDDALRYDAQLVSCQLTKARALFALGSKADAIAILILIKPNASIASQNEIIELIEAWEKAD
jgi:protein O-mannosyl-transferase